MLYLYGLFSFFLAVAYASIMRMYWRGWHGLPEWQLPQNYVPRTAVTVVVPARNEAEQIEACLLSIVNGSYPLSLLQIIVVDDHSDDRTVEIVQHLAQKQTPNICLLHLKDYLLPGEQLNSHKKKAIEVALAQATGSIVVTTDADCLVQPDWLRLIVSVFESHADTVKMVAAPVAFHRSHNLLQRFQALDFAGMMGITGAGIHRRFQRMGNGANLAYTKAAFESVGGFAGVDGRASGDDMFLLQKVAHRYPDGIFFLKNATCTVFTEAKPDWRGFVQQRIRWGSKNAAYPEKMVTLILAAVFFFCWNIVLNMAALLVFPSFSLFGVLFFQLSLKAVADYFFLGTMVRWFGQKGLLRWFVPSFFLHIAYIAGIGLVSQFVKKYEWKGRRVQ